METEGQGKLTARHDTPVCIKQPETVFIALYVFIETSSDYTKVG